MEFFTDFMNAYGLEILKAIILAIVGYVGIMAKNIYQKYINDKTKKSVVNTCVKAVEQLYKDLGGEQKLEQATEAATEMLNEKGINITQLELRYMIEEACNEFEKKMK